MSYDDEECVRPPHGWKCSRGNGHPGPCAARPAEDDDLIERAARAARRSYVEGTGVRHLDYAELSPARKDLWRDVARAVLDTAAAQPPAPITAEDVRAAARAYVDLSTNEALRTDEAAFVADYLNRRQR